MAVSTQSTVTGVRSVAADSRRAGRELVLEWVFQPLSSALVPLFLRLRTPPPAVVLANAVAGLSAALAIGRGALVAAALLLQLKTLLDNLDGRLARASGRVTLAGRFLDTIADLVVNAALFIALGYATGEPLLALGGFVALTAVLTVDFNVSELAREAHGAPSTSPDRTGSRSERLLGAVYAGILAPQDRLVRSVSQRRYERAIGGKGSVETCRAYFDSLSLSVLANLGLTTQLAALGVCLALGAPTVYPWLAMASLLVVLPLQLRRERLVRRAVGR